MRVAGVLRRVVWARVTDESAKRTSNERIGKRRAEFFAVVFVVVSAGDFMRKRSERFIGDSLLLVRDCDRARVLHMRA